MGKWNKAALGEFMLGNRKRFFIEGVACDCIMLPREEVTAPRLTECKDCLDNTLSHMVQFQVVLQGAGIWI